MIAPRWNRPEDGALPKNDLNVFAELVLQLLRHLGSINKELKYANYLRVIELKSAGLYDDDQLREDVKQFGLES
jgi:hypothetical protein